MTIRFVYQNIALCYRIGILNYSKVIFLKVFSPSKEIRVSIPGSTEKVFLRKHSSDQDVFNQIFVDRGYAPPFLEGFSPETIVDAGAYVGYSTAYFANKYPDAFIVAIEPEPANFQLLEKNTRQYKNVHCINAALWSKKTNVELSSPTGREWSFRSKESAANTSRSIPTITVPEIIGQFHLSSVDFLKIDIEGAEKELFSEQYGWLKVCKIIAIELHERFAPYCSKAFYNAISQYPFRQYHRRENIFVDLR